MSFRIRPYHPADLTRLYRVCLLTAHNGQDASALFRDPDLIGHFYVAPYAVLEPDLSFVLTDSGMPCGYVLGVADSQRFYERCELDWFPRLRERYPMPAEADHSSDAQIIRLIHKGHRPEAGLEGYPAHLHIDLLPVAQGQGWGRKLMETLCSRLRDLDAAGVHLQVGKGNANAIGFYRRLGFQVLAQYPGALALGMRL